MSNAAKSILHRRLPFKSLHSFLGLSSWNSCAMASTKAKLNRLAQEKSPYLQQHASNPVDWYPWGKEAFDKAKKENKPIFLSVGYSTCHWCHVMERESFENEEIGKILNDNFVCIKVDREERPDVDKVYMTYVQATQGSGGWPMSVWLTPDLKPIVGGTYFPPDDRYHGTPGFKTILNRITTKWIEAADQISNQGTTIIDALMKGLTIKPVAGEDYMPSTDDVRKGFIMLGKSYDPTLGGFGTAPKFPQPVNFSVLWRTHDNGPETEDGHHALQMATFTLKQMAKGGMYDHVAEGFHRYSTDARWHVPHFEKMLYDQAQLATAYLLAYQITRDETFADVARKIFLYVNRDMSNKNGGFYSAEDADSLPTESSKEKKEGAFCVWKMDEIQNLLSDPLPGKSESKVSDLFCVHYGVNEQGNVDPYQDPHNELKLQNVLMVQEDLSVTADLFGISRDEASELLATAREKLFKVREDRPKPHKDTKMLTAWNGLMLSAFALGAQVLNDVTYRQRAVQAAEFIHTHLYDVATGTLLRSIYTADDQDLSQIDKPIGGFVEDYTFLIRGLIDLYEASFDEQWLEWALKLQETQDRLFWDSEDGGYFSSVANDASILIRMKDDQDNAEPSANSVSAMNLLRLAEFLDQPDLQERSRSLLNTFGERLRKVPVSLPEMLSAVYFLSSSPQQIVIVGDAEGADTRALIGEVHSHFLPNKVLIVTNGNGDGFLSNRNKSLATMTQVGGKATAYVCKNRSCSLPVTSSGELSKLLKES